MLKFAVPLPLLRLQLLQRGGPFPARPHKASPMPLKGLFDAAAAADVSSSSSFAILIFQFPVKAFKMRKRKGRWKEGGNRVESRYIRIRRNSVGSVPDLFVFVVGSPNFEFFNNWLFKIRKMDITLM